MQLHGDSCPLPGLMPKFGLSLRSDSERFTAIRSPAVTKAYGMQFTAVVD